MTTLVVADNMLFVAIPGQRYLWALSGCPEISRHPQFGVGVSFRGSLRRE
jgi:hypothetical protein